MSAAPVKVEQSVSPSVADKEEERQSNEQAPAESDTQNINVTAATDNVDRDGSGVAMAQPTDIDSSNSAVLETGCSSDGATCARHNDDNLRRDVLCESDDGAATTDCDEQIEGVESKGHPSYIN